MQYLTCKLIFAFSRVHQEEEHYHNQQISKTEKDLVDQTFHTEYALFVVKNSEWVKGSETLAGTTHKFKGLAVHALFSVDGTARLELLVNQNGKKDIDQMREALRDQGHSSCEVHRPGTWHGSDLGLKLMIKGPTMYVQHDSYGAAEWRDCIDASFLWPHEVLENVHVGMAVLGPQASLLTSHVTVPYLKIHAAWDDKHAPPPMPEGYINYYEPAHDPRLPTAAQMPQTYEGR